MDESLTIDEVVRRTGLTSRALRFYEGRGLVSPLRTQSGRRWFGPAELERIHHIVALKKAGLSLGDIKRLLDRKQVDIAALLTAQRVRLAEQARDIAAAAALIDSALSRIDRGEPLDAATLCSLIRNGDQVMPGDAKAWKQVVDRYYTTEEQISWDAQMVNASEFRTADNFHKWRALSDRIEAALPLEPESEAALALVREWFTLLEPFSRNATPELWAASARMYADMKSWDGEVDPGFSKRAWDFIADVSAKARAAGKDIGPLPAFLREA